MVGRAVHDGSSVSVQPYGKGDQVRVFHPTFYSEEADKERPGYLLGVANESQ